MNHVEMETYSEAHDAFQWQVPDNFNFGTDVIDKWAEDKNKLALIWLNEAGDERRLTFHQIKILSNQFANLLASNGVKKGDRVLVMLPRLPEWQIALVGCNKLGAVPVPCITMLTKKDVTYRVRHCNAVAAVTTTENISKFDAVPELAVRISIGGDGDEENGWTDLSEGLAAQPETFDAPRVAAEDPAILYYTSGSTGEPKGVLHSARALFAWRVSAWYWLTTGENDLIWCTADTGWSKAATSILYGPWSCGAASLFYDGPFDAEKRIDILERYKVSVYCAPATELRQLIGLELDQRDLTALRHTVSAGESVNPEIVRQWQASTGAMLLDGYGQTETLMTVVNYPCMKVKPGSMGRPLPGTDVTVLDDDNKPVPVGTVGQLAIKCPHPQIMLGYWNDTERTAKTRVSIDGIEWFVTGDTARMDDEGYLYYEGRNDDVINSAGYRIGPMEVENALMEHKAVKECAVVGGPHEERGEIVTAFIVLNKGYNGSAGLTKEVQDFTKQLTAPYKYPRKIIYVGDLPRTATGKLSRRLLKNQEYGRG